MEAPAQGGCCLEAGARAPAAGGGPGTRKPKVECGERLVELHASFRELVTFFCTNTTIHGSVRLICSSQNRLKTVSWGLLLVGTLGMLYWQFGLLFEQYWRYPVIMTVSVHSERKLFPSVTLCDMNPHRAPFRAPEDGGVVVGGLLSCSMPFSALDDFAQENIYSLYGVSVSKTRDALAAKDLGPEPHFQLDRAVRLQKLSPLGGQNRVGFRLCNSSGGDCIHRAYSSGVTAAREWYRFHYVNILALLPPAHEDHHRSLGSHFIFSCLYDGQDCQARHFQTSHHPTYGSCYTFDGIWATQCPGITHGISLVLRTEQQDHLPLLSTEAGVKVMIHKRDHTPFLEHRSFSVRPGTETTIGIRETGPCPHGAALTPPRCAWGWEEQWPQRAFRVQDWTLSVLGKPGHRSPSPRSNLAKVNILYQELNYRTVDETPIYSVPRLLSAMGSLWSLWFGSSVLSVLEVLELLLDAAALTFLLCCRRLHAAQRQPRAATRAPTPSQRPASCPVAGGTSDVQCPG
ncbi:Amiloride-sensitive sodium channel delta-subunit-like protein [Camelus ferus]|nr:Amiloride-sensitive sodium channel delta-subunit-like protein [Camelus ferus]